MGRRCDDKLGKRKGDGRTDEQPKIRGLIEITRFVEICTEDWTKLSVKYVFKLINLAKES